MSGLFFNFRKYFFDRNINQNRPSNASRKGSNLKQARTFGILFNASNAENNEVAENLQKFLENQKKEVTILGYKKDRTKEEVLPPHIFSKESIQWNFIPDNSTLNSFIQHEFDILICLQQENDLPIEYIMALSHAKFRVGKHFDKQEANYELMIETSEDEGLFKLSDQIKNWLTNLKFD